MSDLGRDLRAILRTVNNLERRVRDLEAQNRFTAATDWSPSNWWGRCSPTSPASKIIQVHGGFLWWWESGGVDQGFFRRMDDTIYDFNAVAPFAASGHCKWCVLSADLSGNAPAFDLWESPEFASAGLAEADFWANGPLEDLYGASLPLCAVVAQNDGNTGVAGAVYNVTLADRSQSYFLARDFRPWLHVHAPAP